MKLRLRNGRMAKFFSLIPDRFCPVNYTHSNASDYDSNIVCGNKWNSVGIHRLPLLSSCSEEVEIKFYLISGYLIVAEIIIILLVIVAITCTWFCQKKGASIFGFIGQGMGNMLVACGNKLSKNNRKEDEPGRPQPAPRNINKISISETELEEETCLE